VGKLKRILTSILIIGSILSLVNAGLAFENEPEGFRSSNWGGPPEENMILVDSTKDGQSFYRVPKEKMSIGDAKFYMITYSFFGQPQKFMGVILAFRGEENYDLLKTICEGKFGEPTKKRLSELEWQGQITTIVLNYDLVDEDGALALVGTSIFSEYLEAKQKKQIEKAEEDW